MKKYFMSLILVTICFTNGNTAAQVVVERSKDKVTIAGVPYFVHTVKKGETAYSISRAYNVTVDELTKENPPVVYGVKEGQALRIPVRPASPPPVQAPVIDPDKRDEGKYIYHKLQPGETIYYLSRKYGLSENEIILSNPGIEINKLPVNAEIQIPRKQFMNERQKFDVQGYKYHRVVKGETLSSIASKYGLTIRELRRENRDVRFPQVGDYIRIPGSMRTSDQIAEPAEPDTILIEGEGEVIMRERPYGFTPVTNLGGSLNVAVLLPFYIEENARRIEIDSSKSVKGKKTFKVITRQNDWIYPRSIGFLEMYQGILLAADTLRSLGLDVTINAFDIQSDTVEITRLIRSGRLDKMDLIIGPIHSGNLSLVASYAGMREIPVVSPVPLVNNSSLLNNPTLFMANPSLEVNQMTIAKKISEYYDHNFVFIHSDDTGIDDEVQNFKKMIFDELKYKIPYEEIRFKEIVFYSRSKFGTDSISRLGHALSNQLKNVVVIASEDTPVMSETITDIHAISKKFDIKVLGYPYMRNLDNLDPKYFFDLGLMVYSPYWIDYTRNDVKRFITHFRNKFLTEPKEISYAWQGYDIAYYFMSGLAIHGREFILHPEIHNPDLLQTEFDFHRKRTIDGLENHKLFLIHYTNTYDIRMIEENLSLGTR
jgi:LysM repeat protein